MYNAQFPDPQQAGPGGAMPMMPGAPAMPPQGPGPMAPAQVAPGQPGMQQLDPAIIQQILAMQSQQGGRNQAQRQASLANMLRGQGMSQLMDVKRPGLANVAAAGVAGYMANRAEEKAAARESALDSELQAGRGKLFDLVRGLRSDAR